MKKKAKEGKSLPVLHTDAAINFGNSGGPVCIGNKVVGVAFQSLTHSNSIGYLIPAPVVKHFIAGVEKTGRYVGFCSLNLSYQPMDAHFRSHFKMNSEMTGILIYNINQHSDALNILKIYDVILAIDGVAIENDGTSLLYFVAVILPNRERITLDDLVSMKQLGETILLKILREGKMHEFSITLKPVQRLVPANQYDNNPSYYIFAGFVFVTLRKQRNKGSNVEQVVIISEKEILKETMSSPSRPRVSVPGDQDVSMDDDGRPPGITEGESVSWVAKHVTQPKRGETSQNKGVQDVDGFTEVRHRNWRVAAAPVVFAAGGLGERKENTPMERVCVNDVVVQKTTNRFSGLEVEGETWDANKENENHESNQNVLRQERSEKQSDGRIVHGKEAWSKGGSRGVELERRLGGSKVGRNVGTKGKAVKQSVPARGLVYGPTRGETGETGGISSGKRLRVEEVSVGRDGGVFTAGMVGTESESRVLQSGEGEMRVIGTALTSTESDNPSLQESSMDADLVNGVK
ncbi:unnamed protein product [Arabidopsis halleri]